MAWSYSAFDSGIGYILARQLLRTYGAKVVLLGRTVLRARWQWEEWLTEHGRADAASVRIQHVKELESLGGELLLLAADVADEEAMSAAWETIEARWEQAHPDGGASRSERAAGWNG